MVLLTTISPALNKKMANFGPLTPEIMGLVFTHLKLTVCVLCMLMHLSSGHVTFCYERNFNPISFPTPFGFMVGQSRVRLRFQFLV